MSEFHHIPILRETVVALLAPQRGGIFVDGTLGGGGHAEAVLERFMALTGMVLQLRLHPGGLLDMVKRLPPFMEISLI